MSRDTPDPGPILALLEIMVRLRDPARGCPWDVAQDFSTIAPYTIEEAYEVADAIARADLPALREELGDLLFQVCLLYTSPSPRDLSTSRMPSSA